MSQQPRHRAADHSRHKASHRADNPAPKHVKAPGADPRNQANPAAQHTGANPYLDSKEGAAQTGYRAPAPNPVLSSDAPIGHTAHGFKPVREVGGGKHKISKQKPVWGGKVLFQLATGSKVNKGIPGKNGSENSSGDHVLQRRPHTELRARDHGSFSEGL